jgi:hypothetical protein
MSNVQRWDAYNCEPDPTGNMVLYVDHVAALAQARLADSLREGERADREYDRGQRDERKRIRVFVQGELSHIPPPPYNQGQAGALYYLSRVAEQVKGD